MIKTALREKCDPDFIPLEELPAHKLVLESDLSKINQAFLVMAGSLNGLSVDGCTYAESETAARLISLGYLTKELHGEADGTWYVFESTK